MGKHGLWHIVGCGLPLLLIFIAPALGISDNLSIFLFIVLMFACHLMMLRGHGAHSHNGENRDQGGDDELPRH